MSQFENNFKNTVHVNLTAPELTKFAESQPMVKTSADDAVVATTGLYTGRAPENRFIVDTPAAKNVDFGAVNKAFDANDFATIFSAVKEHLYNTSDVFIQQSRCGADNRYSLNVRVVSESPWHTLFAQNMFIDIDTANTTQEFDAGFTVWHAPFFNPKSVCPALKNEACVLINFDEKVVLIAGTEYAGEIKKSIFSVMNYVLPSQDVFPMHCSANMGENGDTAVFFGLSGTGKTTLSADASRILIGDDEHGWSDTGVFNMEGGCYAKAIGITAESEPEIFATTQMPATILENVILDENNIGDFEDTSLTKNTRISYPISSIPNASETGLGNIPKNVIMLTCDAFGVLPPVSKMSKDQAMYHFLSGYTAKVAGTEVGITEPVATFSACFGAPFMPMHPTKYGEMLQEMIEKHDTKCWLVNTGWTGGSYGTGNRIKLKYTRAIITAILNGELDKQDFTADALFEVLVPNSCPDVPEGVLNPIDSWADKDSYNETAQKLLGLFEENFKKFQDQDNAKASNA